MVNLICLNSVSQWERDQVLQYPELQLFIDKLKDIIRKNPNNGFPDPLLLPGMRKNLPCFKHSVKISLFSNKNAMGYSFVTASYLPTDTEVIIMKMSFS
ncbi:MAG: hypothetical protein LBQ94_03635 [Treponema sp.]|jgi:hypothetical protein|nr:hypothetical protein [Treponema sp.]